MLNGCAESNTKSVGWQHFAHDADLGIRGYGDSLASAYEQAAVALTAAICEVNNVKSLNQIRIQCEAPDCELLFVDWLNAVIYEMAVNRMLFSKYEVHTDGLILTATAWGEGIDRIRHQPAVEIKGATYTELKVYRCENGRWVAQCVVDV